MDASWIERFLHSLGGLTMVFLDAQVPARVLLLLPPQARPEFPSYPNTSHQLCKQTRERKCGYLLSSVWGGFWGRERVHAIHPMALFAEGPERVCWRWLSLPHLSHT